MNLFNKISRAALSITALTVSYGVAAAWPTDWQKEQHFEIAAPGLVKINLPLELIDASRPGLEDLRLYDGSGSELPYAIERPRPIPKSVRSPLSFVARLEDGKSVVILQTGFTEPVEAVTFDTPATSFIKPVKVEGSSDGHDWQLLARGVPIFREMSGANQLRIPVPAGVWPWLRLTVDDQRSQPIPFTGVHIHAASAQVPPTEPINATIVEQHQNPGETRLTLDLGAANLDIASVQIETSDPLFKRNITFAVPQISADSVRDQTLGQGTIYRTSSNGDTTAANLVVPLEAQVRGRRLLLLIRNDDSPPLTITGVRVERRPVHLIFMAKSGIHHLLTGNPRCPAPQYDLAALGANFKNTPISTLQPSALANNPDYRAPEALAGIDIDGAPLDVSAWKFRKALKLLNSGAQEVELDLDVLSHAQGNFQDLRLMRGGKQVPYLLERPSISRDLTVTASESQDPASKSSIWKIKLPQANLPLTRLSCVSTSALFSRAVSLYEDLPDDRGQPVRYSVGNAPWTQTPDRKGHELVLMFDHPPMGDTLILTIPNGDNPPINLKDFRVYYPATRLLFKAKADDEILLYYGNPNASSPQYDLNLVANQLLAADKSTATLVAEQQLKKSSWEAKMVGKGGVVFWGILALVVVGLLAVISRLLPKES